MNINRVYILGRYKPICHTKYGLLLYRRENLYLMNVKNNEISFVAPLPIEDPRKLFCFCDLLTRLMHISVYCGIEVDNGAIVAFNKGIYFVDLVSRKITREHDFKAIGMRRPLSFCKIKDINGFEDEIVYGEYFSNDLKEAVCIWGRNSNGMWTERYRFQSNTIRHIHTIIPDPFQQRVIVCTGDMGKEAAIWSATNNFEKVEKIVGDNQLYRICCVRAYKDGILCATDSPYDNNYIYMLENNSKKVKILSSLPGPVVFYCNYKENIVFATNVENDGRNMGKIRQMISYKRGLGVKDWYVHVFIGNPNQGFKEILKMKKDIFPMASFGFGNVHFPYGEIRNKIFFYPTAVKKLNEKMCYLDFGNF